MNNINKLYAEKTISTIIAKNNLEAEPHTWTKGLDYELIEKKDYFTLSSNEGSVNYVNEVKDEVLLNFKRTNNYKPNYFEVGTRVQVIKPFWFYDEYYEIGTVFVIEEEHHLHDFKDKVVNAYL